LQGTIYILQDMVASYFSCTLLLFKMLQIFGYWASYMQPHS